MRQQRLIGMEVSNFLKVSLLELRFGQKENLIIISGNNGEGKTSALNAVEAALAGGNAVPIEALKKGKAKGYTVLETTDYIIKRTYTKSGTSLVVEAKEGGAISSPQKLLSSLVGSISFDPLAFSNMKNKDQLEALQQLLKIDFADLDREHREVFQERRDLKRDLKAMESRYDGIELNTGVPKEVIYSEDIIKKLEAAQEKHDEAAEARQQVKDLLEEKGYAHEEVEEAEAELASAEEVVKQAQAKVEAFRKVLKSKPPAIEKAAKKAIKLESALPDLDAIKKELAEVDGVNEKIRSNILRKNIRAQVDKLQGQVDAKDERLKAIEAQKQSTLEEAKMPVKGLSFDETGVRFNDIPFEQCSQAEKLRVSTAMGMAENPKLPLILIRDGSLLDEKSMKLMAQLADEFKCQVLLEYAGAHKHAKVVLENGEAKGD